MVYILDLEEMDADANRDQMRGTKRPEVYCLYEYSMSCADRLIRVHTISGTYQT